VEYEYNGPGLARTGAKCPCGAWSDDVGWIGGA